jgi:hypothetical protein
MARRRCCRGCFKGTSHATLYHLRCSSNRDAVSGIPATAVADGGRGQGGCCCCVGDGVSGTTMKVGQSGEVGAAGASATPRRDFLRRRSSVVSGEVRPGRQEHQRRCCVCRAAGDGNLGKTMLYLGPPVSVLFFCWLGTLTHCLTVMIKLIVGLPTRGIGRFDPPGDAQHAPNRDKRYTVKHWIVPS